MVERERKCTKANFFCFFFVLFILSDNIYFVVMVCDIKYKQGILNSEYMRENSTKIDKIMRNFKEEFSIVRLLFWR